jgi:indolepyruvate ferredoxin oxidoreductase beta subunit
MTLKGLYILTGVGGQGVLFATRILCGCAVEAGLEIIGSETHGMAQRGGSVVSHVKIGGFESSLVRRGSADYLFCFDKNETLRNAGFLKKGGACFINAPDVSFIPAEAAKALGGMSVKIRTVDADKISMKLGVPLASNLVLLGHALSGAPINAAPGLLEKVVGELSPERFREKNLEALRAGIHAV